MVRTFSDIACEARVEVGEGGYLIGILKGEGIGPEIMDAALCCLDAVRAAFGVDVSLEYGGNIGRTAERDNGSPLPDEVRDFCAEIFSRGGAILAGAGGGRFVYDLRKCFGLYCKLSPLRAFEELHDAGCLKSDHLRNVDIMVVRENISGVYQGQWMQEQVGTERCATHAFQYRESEVRSILRVAASLAARRSRHLTVIAKESGLPSISALWKSCADELGEEFRITWTSMDVDYASYWLIKEASAVDVVVAPNLFGDILSDLGALLLGSRGLSYSGNFSKTGSSVYQTNHGAAYELAGTDTANPIGQILSLGMLLEESMGLAEAAQSIEQAVRVVLRQGYRTFDIMNQGCRLTGTRELGQRIADQIHVIQDHAKSKVDGVAAG